MFISVNGSTERLPEDPRGSLLDYLREDLQLHGTKKGLASGGALHPLRQASRRSSQ